MNVDYSTTRSSVRKRVKTVRFIFCRYVHLLVSRWYGTQQMGQEIISLQSAKGRTVKILFHEKVHLL